MPLLKFKTFEQLDEFEKQGKGINWNFNPNESYYKKVFKYRVKVPFPPGLYKFKSFDEAQEWERKKWIEHGSGKRTN